MKLASTVLLVRPVRFGFNDQTAISNAFQKQGADPGQIQDRALSQFDEFVTILRQNGINVLVFEDTLDPHTPDSIFPNNWISTHENGDIFLYPMEAPNRRPERRADIISYLKENFAVHRIYDLSYFEDSHRYLEGTGSVVLDRQNRIAYACISSRTDIAVVDAFCRIAGYTPHHFHATDKKGVAIYHTNVMMCIGDRFAVICLEAINDIREKTEIQQRLKNTKKDIIEISLSQLSGFAGNILQLINKENQAIIVMSERAFNCLSDDQKNRLQKYGTLVHTNLDEIENTGGGSARCMIAEIFLPNAK